MPGPIPPYIPKDSRFLYWDCPQVVITEGPLPLRYYLYIFGRYLSWKMNYIFEKSKWGQSHTAYVSVCTNIRVSNKCFCPCLRWISSSPKVLTSVCVPWVCNRTLFFYIAFHRSHCDLKATPWDEIENSRTLKMRKWVTPCPLAQLKRKELDLPLFSSVG